MAPKAPLLTNAWHYLIWGAVLCSFIVGYIIADSFATRTEAEICLLDTAKKIERCQD